MKTVKFGTILENAARLAGRQVATMGVPENWRALAALAIGDGLRRLAAEKFPLLQRVEYRRYRPDWIGNIGWTKGQECWFGDAYWRLEAEAGTGVPSDAGSGWRRLDMAEVVAFVAFDQPWEPVVMDGASVDFSRFAYAADPKLNPTATPLKVAGMTELGVILQAPAPTGVYVKFVPRHPNVSFVEWSQSADYEAGDVVYLTQTKDCYRCAADVAAGGKSPAEDAQGWFPLRIPDAFEGYLTRLASVDLLTEDQGKYQTRAAAEKEFDELCARHHEGNGETRVRTGRFR